MITEQEWREWKSLRSLAYPGPETLHTVYRVAYPALLDEVEKLRAKVTALEGGIVAENRRSTEERTALQARVAVLEVWYSMQPVRADDDDPSLTCVLCNGTGCEFTIQTSNGGTKYWYGIHKTCREQARDRGVSPTPEISVVTRMVFIKTWHTERGWSASEDGGKFFHIEAEGGETARKAADNVIGAIMIALGQREHPPYSVRFVVRREECTTGGV